MARLRRNALRFLVGSAATGFFLWLFLREVDLGEAWREIMSLPGWTVVGAVVLILVNLAFMAVRWKILLRGAGFQVSLRSLGSTVAVGRAANNVIPARGGDFLRIESMRELSYVPVFVTAGTLFAERLLDGVVLASWIVLGALLVGESNEMLLTGVALSAGTALGVLLCVIAARDLDRTEQLLWRATRRLPLRWHTRVARATAHFVEGLGAFGGRRRLVMALGATVGMWLADVVMYGLLGSAFDLDLEAGAYFLLEGIGNLALAVPTTAAGLGTFDYITLLAARTLDVPEAKATGYVLTVHAMTVLPVTILGALLLRPAFPRLFRSGEGRQTIKETP